ncbi:hypothetical protein LMH73_025095, partial [Vibrio splendidus]
RTASGKDTVAAILREKFGYHKAITTTTRPPRPYEVDGVHYHFLEERDFKDRVEYGEFIEHENNKGNYYGCSFSAILDTPSDKPTVMILDPAGAMNLRDFLLAKNIECKVLYINESVNTCIERVKCRDADAAEIERSVESLRGKESGWNVGFKYDAVTVRGATIEENVAYARNIFECERSLSEDKVKSDSLVM